MAEAHQIPVLPSEYEVEVGNLNTVVNINQLGNINLIGGSDLKKFTIESFFPNQDYPFVTTQRRHDPSTYIESIERWRKTKMPIRLVVTGTPINLAMAIERFTYGERDGSGDVYYVLEMAEYVFTGAKKKTDDGYKAPSKPHKFTDKEVEENKAFLDDLINFYESESSLKPTLLTTDDLVRDVRDKPKVYIVKPGDTLTTIAKRTTGNAGNYKEIAERNNIKNPNRITVGMELKL